MHCRWGEETNKKGKKRKYWVRNRLGKMKYVVFRHVTLKVSTIRTINLSKLWHCRWGTKWGEKGAFRILRGENHLGIEENVLAVHADLIRSLAIHPSDRIRDQGLINIYSNKQIVVIKRPRPTDQP